MRQRQIDLSANVTCDSAVVMLAHDLRAPLGVMLGYLSLIEDGTFAVPRRTRIEVIGVVTEKAREMNRLIDGVLGDSGEHKHEQPRCDVRKAVREAVARAKARAALERATVQAELPDDAVWTSADSAQIGRILDNLIGNALTYSHRPALVSVEVRIDDPVAVVVRDHGVGIPLDQHQRVFQAGHRGPVEGSGAGLGLAVCRELAAANGGSVDLEWSVPGEGSVFVVHLPRLLAAVMADDPRSRRRKGNRSARTVVYYNGVRYWRDLAKCRNELTRLQAAGEVGTVGIFAKDVGLSRSTTERFLSGWDVSMPSTMKILGRLGLGFEDVHEMVEGGRGEAG